MVFVEHLLFEIYRDLIRAAWKSPIDSGYKVTQSSR